MHKGIHFWAIITISTALFSIHCQSIDKQAANNTAHIAASTQAQEAKIKNQTTTNNTSGTTNNLPKTNTSQAQTASNSPAVNDNANKKSVAPIFTNKYAWLNNTDDIQALSERIAVPQGYERIHGSEGSFSQWLQNLPLKKGKPDVLLYNGQTKGNQTAHVAVVKIDVGNTDLQQCADAVMRLRAEYLWAAKQYNDIHFRFTSGQDALYSQWQKGYRPSIAGSSVLWNKTNAVDNSYLSFRKYLNQIFTYCGTSSLSKEMKPVANINDIQAGDVFIKGGFPGHAVIVLDIAKHTKTGEKIFLLAQSYMPAQEIHLLRNPNNDDLSPWYQTNFGEQLHTPEWTFTNTQLKRF